MTDSPIKHYFLKHFKFSEMNLLFLRLLLSVRINLAVMKRQQQYGPCRVVSCILNLAKVKKPTLYVLLKEDTLVYQTPTSR